MVFKPRKLELLPKIYVEGWECTSGSYYTLNEFVENFDVKTVDRLTPHRRRTETSNYSLTKLSKNLMQLCRNAQQLKTSKIVKLSKISM